MRVLVEAARAGRRSLPPTPRAERPRRISLAIASLALAFALAACGDKAPPAEAAPPTSLSGLAVPPARTPRDLAILEVAGFGEIRFELLDDVAPATAANFARLAEAGFYDGTTFHRVIPEFMIQGGDPNSRDRDPRNDGMGEADASIPDEFGAIGHRRGIVSMANSGRPGSASSQFFVVVADRFELDGHYAVFGNVVSGMDVAERVAATPRDVYGRHGPLDRPIEDVVLKRVRIERAAAPSKSAPNAVASPEARG